MHTLTGRIIIMAIGLLGMVGCAGERPQNLGTKDGLLLECPSSPSCVSSQADDGKHRIAPLAFSGDPDEAFARLKQVLGRRVRSASRLGYSDLGKNRSRMEEIRSRYIAAEGKP